MNNDEIIAQIKLASQIIPELHKKVHYWAKRRSESAGCMENWSAACAEFHKTYNKLAFYGDWDTARDRIRSGDKICLEYALCFIEIRPYFFRSGYMYQALIKCLNRISMSDNQRKRYERVKNSYLTFLANRRLTSR